MRAEVIIVQPSAGNPKSTKDDELYKPPAEANRLKADFYLSLHVNAGGGEGFESFVHPSGQGKEVDKTRSALHRQIVQYLARYQVRDRGQKYANFAVLRLAKMPAVLLECLFIDNAKDAALLKDQAFIDGLSNEIAYGLIIALGLERG